MGYFGDASRELEPSSSYCTELKHIITPKGSLCFLSELLITDDWTPLLNVFKNRGASFSHSTGRRTGRSHRPHRPPAGRRRPGEGMAVELMTKHS